MVKLRVYHRPAKKRHGVNRFVCFELSVTCADLVIATLTLTVCLPKKRGV